MVNRLAQSHPASELERKHHGPCSQVTYSLGTRHTMTIQSSKECWNGGMESDGIVPSLRLFTRICGVKMMMSLFSTICSTETLSAISPEMPETLYLEDDRNFPLATMM